MVVVAQKFGQLANRLFGFAHFVAAASEHGFRVANPAFDEYADYFPATAADALCRFPPRTTRPASIRRPVRRAAFGLMRRVAGFQVRYGGLGRAVHVIRIPAEQTFELGSAEFIELARTRIVLVQGWLFRDDASLARQREILREHFRPQPALLQAADEAAARARDGLDVLVGVHVRRGDYRQFMHGRYFWGLPEYARLMEAVERLFPGRTVGFLVCSDEDVDLSAFGVLRVGRGTGHPIEDLYAFARCDLLLGPPSTYTSWASFYGAVPFAMIRDARVAPRLEDFAPYGL